MATLLVNGVTDFRGGAAETNIDRIQFVAFGTALFTGSQFGAGLIANNVTVAGSTGFNSIEVHLSGSGSFVGSGWTFESWEPNDLVSVDGSTGNDTFIGTSQKDFFDPNGGRDTIDGGGGDDRLLAESQFAAGSVLNGGPGRDSLLLNGSPIDLQGVEVFGYEIVDFSPAPAKLTLAGTQIGTGLIDTVRGDGVTGVSILEVRGAAVDLSGLAFDQWGLADRVQILGTGPANALTGSAVGDIISGTGSSADTMTGGDGADTLNGGGGSDTFRYTGGQQAVAGETVDGGAGIDTIELVGVSTADFRDVSIDGVERLRFGQASGRALLDDGQLGPGGIGAVIGSRGVDRLEVQVADQLADLSGVAFSGWDDAVDTIRITGGASLDLLTGTAQADILDGGAAADFLRGGPGDDIYVVDAAGDVLIENAGEGIDEVQSVVSFTLSPAQELENLTLLASAVSGIGNALDNRILGNGTDNELQGLDGNDRLDGSSGADDLRGGTGDDSMAGGDGNDRYFVDSALDKTGEFNADPATGGIDTVFSTVSRTLGDNLEILRLQGAAGLAGTGNGLANKLFGTAGANLLKGLAGNDTIEGKDGNDTLDGGAGNDTLTGGSQADVFRFAATNAGVDTITDFSKAADRFDLSGGTFTALSIAPNGDAVLTHAGGAIRIQHPPTLTLAQWNALVVPSGSRVAEVSLALDDDFASHSPLGLQAATHGPTAFVHQGDWMFV